MNRAAPSTRDEIVAELSSVLPAYRDATRRLVELAMGIAQALGYDPHAPLPGLLTEHCDLDARVRELHRALTTSPGPQYLGGTDGH
ncbi:hypothetical protein ACQPZ2_30125 [Nocardia pseudovaccinii]|uniref:hypothetical protein n=1 Tax=Nocardia pseudovaccinii TaxID=189540 RepID=UPI003D8E3D13